MACERAFITLKIIFITASILCHFDLSLLIFVKCDASDFVSFSILSQKDEGGILWSVTFMFKKHSPQECNYEIYDKKLLTIIRSFECWTSELIRANHQITVLTDHKNLKYFMKIKQLTCQQVCWSEFLSQFRFAIQEISGKKNSKSDALTQRS